MSKSYKKYPFCKDNRNCGWGKRYANKKVRNTKDIPNGKAYRKCIEPWDFIYDYSDSMTWHEYKHYYLDNKNIDMSVDWQVLYQEWYRYYKRK